MAGSSLETQQLYERLWDEASRALAQGHPQLDSVLPERKNDLRRSVTLALRPSRAVQNSIGELLAQAAQEAPGQHIYRLDELHLTVLSFIPASETWREHLHELPLMRTLLAEVLKQQRPFSIAFRGVTASPGAVMIQGFPSDDSLDRIRDGLRTAFKHNKVGSTVDRRYRINAAHITAMRFCAPMADWSRLLSLLRANRSTDFGETYVTTLDLLEGDWYASADATRTIGQYRLPEAQPC